MFQKFMAEIFPSDVFEEEEGPWTGSGKKQKWKVDVLNNVTVQFFCFRPALIPARLFLIRLILTRCTVSDPTFPTRLSIILGD